jgi:OOP family OmpA-OmpF porin
MFKKFAIAAALAVVASSACAAGAKGFYGGLDVGSTKIDNVDDSSASFGGVVGYGFNRYVALEYGYRRLGRWDIHGGTFDGGTFTSTQMLFTVVGSYPLSQELDVYGRVGFNDMANESSARGQSSTNDISGGVYGAGLRYHFTPTISGRVEVQKPTVDSTNVNVGIVFKF